MKSATGTGAFLLALGWSTAVASAQPAAPPADIASPASAMPLPTAQQPGETGSGEDAAPGESEGEPAPEAVDSEAQEVRELLDHDVADASGALSVDVDRWVLHDILTGGFAMSLPEPGGAAPTDAQAELQVTFASAAAPPPWTDALDQARLLRRLRGEPEQHHRLLASRLQFDIPLHTHPLVDLYIDYFSGRGRWFFGKWLTRSQRYIPLMRPILQRAGLPQDLVYVAMIESGFSASAYSSAAAAGFWQFIGSTGKLYGLRHDMWVDERRDFIRATEAAAQYLKQLHRQMGNWHLAWASYNAGEGRIRRALTRHNVHDFWQLITYPRSVAKETAHYVPKVIAAAMIAKSPERYGFTLMPPGPPLLYSTVPVSQAVDLQAIAKVSGVPIDALRLLNPALLHDVTPPGRTTYLRVPPDAPAQLETRIAALPRSQRLFFNRVRVRRGDTLFGLARRHHVGIAAIRDASGLSSSRLRPGQMLTIPLAAAPGRGRALLARSRPPPVRSSLRARPSLVRRSPRAQARPRRHVVSRGETLWSIARRYRVSVDAIRAPQRPRRPQQLIAGDILEIF